AEREEAEEVNQSARRLCRPLVARLANPGSSTAQTPPPSSRTRPCEPWARKTAAYVTAVKVDAMTLMGEYLKKGPKNTGTTGRGPPKIRQTKKEPAYA